MSEIKTGRDATHEMGNWVAPEDTLENKDEEERLTRGDKKEVGGSVKVKMVRKPGVGRVPEGKVIPGEKVNKMFQEIDELPDQDQLSAEDQMIRGETESEEEE